MKKLYLVFIIMVGFFYANGQKKFDIKKSIIEGKKVYDLYCATCHQSDGGGVQRMNPPLIKTKYVLGNKEELIKIILKGMNEPIEIDGEDFENPMASHSFLSDVQIADVLNYIRNSFGNNASEILPVHVKEVRKKIN